MTLRLDPAVTEAITGPRARASDAPQEMGYEWALAPAPAGCEVSRMCPDDFFGVTERSLAHSDKPSLGQPSRGILVARPCTLWDPKYRPLLQKARSMHLPNANRYQEMPYVPC